MARLQLGDVRPTFDEVFARINRAGEVRVTSSIGTEYRVNAIVARNGVDTLVATSARGGQIRVHGDCWGQDETCKRTRAGGLYHGSSSLFDR